MKNSQWLLEEKYGGVATPEFEADLKRLLAGEPLAYVIGWEPFLGLKIHLDSHPLIPRPETEWWTENLLAHVGRRTSHMGEEEVGGRMKKVWPREARRTEDFLKAVPDLRFLDLCAGSGAIGCAALSRLPGAKVYFGEIDPAHEATIRKNIRENGLDESRAEIRIGDLFAPFTGLRFDVIAANPPYIPTGRTLPESVAKYEPASALYAEEDGLGIIRRIAEALPQHLAKEGIAWIECDSAHGEEARGLFEAAGLFAQIRTDQYGAARFLVISWP